MYVETTLSDLLPTPKKNFTNINTFVNDVVNKMCPKEFYINEGDVKYRLNYIRKMSKKLINIIKYLFVYMNVKDAVIGI